MSEQSDYSTQKQPEQSVITQSSNGFSPTVTKGEWILYLFLQMIPFVNIVMLIIYARDKSKPSRANLAKVHLMFIIVILSLAIIYFIYFLYDFGKAMKSIH
ncbi:MAG: hypothetical protein J6X49_14945 [Victivallales bacterium]|nr:hypothetical protein [Victivallales bacterium]